MMRQFGPIQGIPPGDIDASFAIEDVSYMMRYV